MELPKPFRGHLPQVYLWSYLDGDVLYDFVDEMNTQHYNSGWIPYLGQISLHVLTFSLFLIGLLIMKSDMISFYIKLFVYPVTCL